jgi:secondary thiamine-phosphate synthase enzyme
MYDLKVKTTRSVEARDITAEVANLVKDNIEGRIVHVYTPHTTCGIMINEHADPDVVKDVLDGLERMAPKDYPYRHREGNSHSHIRSALVGTSVTIPVSRGRMALGTWQGIFLMEFDGPRERRVIVTLV